MKNNFYKNLLQKKNHLPFYVYDYDAIKRQILKLKKYLPPNVKVFYSVKANPNIAILKIMKNFGLGTEVVSWGEFLAVQKAGFKPNEILWAGATKSNEEISEAVKYNSGLISLESLSEIERTDKIAKQFNKRQKIIIRLAGDYHANLRFGLTPSELEKILANFPIKFPFLDFKGVHLYETSRIFDADILIKGIERLFLFIKNIERHSGLTFKIIDIGGGFCSNAIHELPVSEFGSKLRNLIDKYHFKDRTIILELGRYLVNNAGYFIAPVIETRGESIIVAGLINYLVRVFRETPSAKRFAESPNNYSINIFPVSKHSRFMPAVISGQFSSLADTFGRGLFGKFLLPCPRKGDLVVIGNVGAYGLTMGLTLFGSRPLAAEFLLINGKLEIIREKGKVEDFLLNQKIPPILKKIKI